MVTSFQLWDFQTVTDLDCDTVSKNQWSEHVLWQWQQSYRWQMMLHIPEVAQQYFTIKSSWHYTGQCGPWYFQGLAVQSIVAAVLLMFLESQMQFMQKSCSLWQTNCSDANLWVGSSILLCSTVHFIISTKMQSVAVHLSNWIRHVFWYFHN